MTSEPDQQGPRLPDIGSLFSQFEQATERLGSAAAEVSRTIVDGTAGNGGVSIEISGDLEAVSVRIDPALVDPEDVSLLEDLVLAALRDALDQIQDLQAEVAESMAGPSVDLSSLTGLLGGLAAGGSGDSAVSGVLGNLSEVLGGLGLGKPAAEPPAPPG